jgi:hypothetical protein
LVAEVGLGACAATPALAKARTEKDTGTSAK